MHLANDILLQAAKTYSTPLYVYNGNLIKQRYNELKTLIPYANLQIHYALKANYNPAILKLLLNEGAHVDTVSPAEVVLCSKLGYSAERMLFTANNFTDAEMHLVRKYGVMFNIGSLSELKRYGAAYPGTKICLRFNPMVIAGAHAKIRTGGDLAKFGILMDDVEEAKRIAKLHKLTVVGLHEHTGSGIKEMDKFIEAINNLLSLATRENFPNLEFVDFGGGFGVPYHPTEDRVDYPAFGKTVTQIMQNASERYGKELRLCFEPGKYIACEAGYLLVQVTALKDNHGRNIAGTNSGFPQLIRPMFYDAYHNILNLSNPQGDIKTYDICGNICETGDRFATDREMPEVREGDILAIQNAGAYCYAMGGVYNLRAMPQEVLHLDGTLTVARRGLTEEELIDSILKECAL